MTEHLSNTTNAVEERTGNDGRRATDRTGLSGRQIATSIDVERTADGRDREPNAILEARDLDVYYGDDRARRASTWIFPRIGPPR